jgi:rhamnosyltransferase
MKGAVSIPGVLVLMATRNGQSWVDEQLESILRQQDVDLRVLVRDDGSSDDTPERIRAWASRHPRVSLLADRTPTGSAAGNFFALMDACDPANTEFIAFADQDDVWHPRKLARAVEALRRSGATGYSAAVRAVWDDGKVRDLVQHPQVRAADFLFEGAGQGCSFVLRASFLLRVQRIRQDHPEVFQSLHYHDWALYALCRAAGGRWEFDPQPCLDYRQHAGNDTGARASGQGLTRRMQLIRQGWYWRQVMAVTGLVRSVHPDNVAARAWHEIASEEAGPGLGKRGRRLLFVARHGRRRPIDRVILMAAVAFGYL